MLQKSFSLLKRFDWFLFIAVFLLVCFGLAAIYSVALSQEEPDFSNFKKQVIIALAGIFLIFLFSILDYKVFKNYIWLFYILSIGLLTAVLLWGKTVRGTTGWLTVGGYSFQPVELVKLFLIIFLASFFAKRAREIYKFKNIALSGFFVAVLVALVLLQPDFGSALILFLLWFVMLLAVKIKKSHLAFMILILAAILVFSWFFVFQDYQKDRIMTFVDPSFDPLGRGYNLTQAKIAIGSGQLLGRGLGFGSQSQLKFLPESQTDFVFAVIAEELGFAAVVLVLVFWAIIFFRMIKGAKGAPDDFGLFLILGAATLFFVQIFINAGMNMGIAPVTGISLPLLSYGGSFLSVCLLLIGIVESVICRQRTT